MRLEDSVVYVNPLLGISLPGCDRLGRPPSLTSAQLPTEPDVQGDNHQFLHCLGEYASSALWQRVRQPIDKHSWHSHHGCVVSGKCRHSLSSTALMRTRETGDAVHDDEFSLPRSARTQITRYLIVEW